MSSNAVIKIENVSKIYKIFDSRSDQMWEAVRLSRRTRAREFWALNDVSFEILKGSTVGILGQNGSGKSTLLQLITGVLQPTFGTVSVHGRIAALLELGAGFNPNLSGRENVIMNGMIMGFKEDEILAKIDSIQDFADIGDFFEQPMKVYSSGMFMRVAFAAAIHVDPDILIIDEALSVGDAKFQEKCFRRFRAFQDAGKTILLVTHDRTAVPRLCNVALLLNKGKLIEFGQPKRIVDLYSNILATGDVIEKDGSALVSDDVAVTELMAEDKPLSSKAISAELLKHFTHHADVADGSLLRNSYNKNEYRYGNGEAQIIDYCILNKDYAEVTTIHCGETMNAIIKIHYSADVDNPLVGVSIRDAQGVLICGLNSEWLQCPLPNVTKNSIHFYKFSLKMNLRPGTWFVEFAVAKSQSQICDIRSNVAAVEVLGGMKSFDGLVFLESELEVL